MSKYDNSRSKEYWMQFNYPVDKAEAMATKRPLTAEVKERSSIMPMGDSSCWLVIEIDNLRSSCYSPTDADRALAKELCERCMELARYFYPDRSDEQLNRLAQLFQDAAEDFKDGLPVSDAT